MNCPKCEYSLYQEGKQCNRCGYTPVEERMNLDADLVRAVHVCVAARRLVDRLAVVHESGKYLAVWALYAAHHGKYEGPFYVDELAELRTALAAYDPEA